jgi:hypothetical protein
VSTLHLMMLIAAAVQFPLAGIAMLAEFSRRKKRPGAGRAPLRAERPATAERAAAAPGPHPMRSFA